MATTATKNPDIRCISQALSVLGDKWTPLLVQQLTICPQTFSDLEKSLEGISPRTLSQRLNKLVLDGIVNKVVYCTHPPRYNYSLTQKGQDLQAILRDMANWSEKYQ
jgi:DNA-binding HxlR family transcriptional regulator